MSFRYKHVVNREREICMLHLRKDSMKMRREKETKGSEIRYFGFYE